MSQQQDTQRQWSGKTGGTSWMQRALVVMFRFLPRELLYGVMALVVPFYMLFNRKGFRAIYNYLRERHGYGPFKALLGVYRNHFVFGQVVLDRFAAFAGKRFKFDIEHLDLFNELSAAPGGFLMLSSHVGCYEIAGYTLISQTKLLNAVVYDGETATINENRQLLLSQHNMRMIPVRSDMSHLFLINAALDNGEIVSMPADRVFGSSKTIFCSLLGAPAAFPRGVFALAKAKEVPMLAVFVMKERVRRYHIFIDRVADAQQFVTALNQVLQRYPTQWFNYYNFWATPATPTK